MGRSNTFGVILVDERQNDSGKTALYAKKFENIRKNAVFFSKKFQKNLVRAKIISTAVFSAFTAIAVSVTFATGHVTFWLMLWIALIFALVFTFIFLDYRLHVLKDGFVKYLQDDEKLEYDEDLDGSGNEEEDEEE